ncbi:MAG TPA: hypothetical protein VKA09_08235 [Nitrososphaeraceae archaeon]|nr:hypothetical protein [Nitrososphaeraceae archaeon]
MEINGRARQNLIYRHSGKDSETILQDDNIRESRAIVRTIESAHRILRNAKIRD